MISGDTFNRLTILEIDKEKSTSKKKSILVL